ncbi:MAG: NAD-dependent deacetylase [Bradyrhizobiaceae bacterium]|nr:MAG: NAD-dependent deacetylase [Bradyrhizobiaceae bacterium]
MTAMNFADNLERLGEWIAEAAAIVPFTGAGISTESGIPDFRSPGGLWTKNRPIPYDEFMSSQDARDEAWRRRLAMQDCFTSARPGRGHRALASLYKAGKVPAVVTQNIDNLHQVSGFAADDVVELHGNTTYALCTGCGKRHEISWAQYSFHKTGFAPSCTACEAPVKTATVSFGQAMPESAMRRAAELARSCDLCLSIGSSLVVWPAAGIPLLAKNSGARLVIVNLQPTELDDIADLVIRHDIGETLAGLI